MYLKKKVVVCMPAYNEEANIQKAVTDFKNHSAVDEVVVCDNNSQDNTGRIARLAGAQTTFDIRQGYGWACRGAMNTAFSAYHADLIILCEPDGSFTARDIDKLLAYSGDFDLVLGTRTTKELIWEGAKMNWFLRLGNWGMGKFIEVLYNAPSLSDVGCTYRLINRKAYQCIAPEFTVGGNWFSPEMMCLAIKRGLRVVEIPVNYLERKGESKITSSDWKAFKLGLRMIYIVLYWRFFNG